MVEQKAAGKAGTRDAISAENWDKTMAGMMAKYLVEPMAPLLVDQTENCWADWMGAWSARKKGWHSEKKKADKTVDPLVAQLANELDCWKAD